MDIFNRMLDQMARDIVKQAQENLQQDRVLEYTKTKPIANKVAGGTLLKSLTYKIRNRKGQYSLTLGADVPYAKTVEEGTPKGTLVDVSDLVHWIKVKNIDTDWASGGVYQAGYMFRKAIAQRGIPPELYYQRAVEKVVPRYRQQLGQAFGDEMIKKF